ncbi:MAG: hypothetical protein IJQ01_00375, partial [Selenomonadaceae bacterium]|nr:hypothetical protein [Selenomonadaceae bacterium]
YSSSINGGEGNDSIYVYSSDYVTVNAGSGRDTIEGTFYSSSIHGGSGNDLISIEGGYNTVLGGTGDDTIMAYIGSISGGVGADLIGVNSSTSYSIATVKGGTGDDTITATILLFYISTALAMARIKSLASTRIRPLKSAAAQAPILRRRAATMS